MGRRLIGFACLVLFSTTGYSREPVCSKRLASLVHYQRLTKLSLLKRLAQEGFRSQEIHELIAAEDSETVLVSQDSEGIKVETRGVAPTFSIVIRPDGAVSILSLRGPAYRLFGRVEDFATYFLNQEGLKVGRGGTVPLAKVEALLRSFGLREKLVTPGMLATMEEASGRYQDPAGYDLVVRKNGSEVFRVDASGYLRTSLSSQPFLYCKAGGA